MEKPITVSFRWTAKEMLLAQGLHMRYSVRAHRVPEGFLLYPSERMFHWLPMHGFQEAADVERLAQLTKATVRQYDPAV